LKCISRWTKTSFTWLFGFVNDLLPPKVPMPKHTYEVKKYMREFVVLEGERKVRNLYSMQRVEWKQNMGEADESS
jgi:hypothetical protein